MTKRIKLALLICCIMLAGCSSSLDKKLVGKWRMPSIDSRWEFFPSGDVTRYSTRADLTTNAKYVWIDKKHIRIEGPENMAGVVEIQIDGNTLVMSRPESTLTYERIPE